MKILIIACIFIASAFAEDKDKCVAGYDTCVKKNGDDFLSRFNCGMGYLKCRFSGMASEDDDLMFDDAAPASCSSEFKKCVLTEGSDKKECMKKLKDCVTAKVTDKKEEFKKKITCAQKCKDETIKCLKAGVSKKCSYKGAMCTKACFTKDDDDRLLFIDATDVDGEEEEGKDDKCVTIYKKCVAKLGKGFINRIKCGKKYLSCRKAQSPKMACMKKCKVAGYDCVKSGASKIGCFKNVTACAKACFSKSEADDELLFSDESTKDDCVANYDGCVKVTGTDFMSRFRCGMAYLSCRYNNAISEDDSLMFDDADSIFTDKIEALKKKVTCGNKCKKELVMCLKNKTSKKECFSKAYKCAKSCFSKDDDDKYLFVDATVVDGEEEEKGKDDKCVAIYKKCVATLGKGFINRIKCGKKYLSCRKSQGSDKMACVKKCKAAASACLKKGKSAADKKECVKTGYACVKKCVA